MVERIVNLMARVNDRIQTGDTETVIRYARLWAALSARLRREFL